MNTKEKLQQLINMLEITLRQKGSTNFILDGLKNKKDAIIVVQNQRDKTKANKNVSTQNQSLTLDELIESGKDFNGPIVFDNNVLLFLLKSALYNINHLEDKLQSIKML
jgi:hypothetical protein